VYGHTSIHAKSSTDADCIIVFGGSLNANQVLALLYYLLYYCNLFSYSRQKLHFTGCLSTIYSYTAGPRYAQATCFHRTVPGTALVLYILMLILPQLQLYLEVCSMVRSNYYSGDKLHCISFDVGSNSMMRVNDTWLLDLTWTEPIDIEIG
jgi:hypothetical protein